MMIKQDANSEPLTHGATSTSQRFPLLVTGIAGVAGYNAFQFFSRRYPGRVIGQRRRDNRLLSGDSIEGLNLDDRDAVKRLFDEHQFKAVVSCGGSCALKACELDPSMAQRVNVKAIENLMDEISGTDTRLIHLSIDLVYSGTSGGRQLEIDRADPVTVYGKTMLESEAIITNRFPHACILRISLPMGVSFNGHAGAIDWIQSRFQQHKPATLYFDEVRTPTYTDCLNKALETLHGNDSRGLFHAGGPRDLSLYEIAQIVNRVGGYDSKLLMGCYRVQAGVIPPRAGNVSMSSSALADELGRSPFDPWPLSEQWVPTHREWHHERDSISGSPQLLQDILYRNPRLS